MDREIFDVLTAFTLNEMLSLTELEKITGLKKYKLNNIIRKVNDRQEYFGCHIVARRGHGYRLLTDSMPTFLKAYKELQNVLNNYNVKDQLFISIAYKNERVMVRDLEEELYITRSVCQSAILELNESLTSYNLEIEFTPYKGYKLIGNERFIRKYLIDNKLYLDEQCEISSNYLSGDENRYINNVLHVQYERVSAGFTITDNNFSILDENKILSQFDLKLNYPNIELSYIAKVLSIFNLPQSSSSEITMMAIYQKFRETFNYNLNDPFIEVHLKNTISICCYAYKHKCIPLNIYNNYFNLFSDILAKLVIEIFGFEYSEHRVNEYSRLFFPIVEYTLRKIVSKHSKSYRKIGLLNNGNIFMLQGLKEEFKVHNPEVIIEQIEMEEISKIDFSKYDAVFTQYFLSEEEMKIISGVRRINVGHHGIALEYDELIRYMETIDYVYYVRNHLKVDVKEALSIKKVLQVTNDLSLILTEDLDEGFYYNMDENTIYVSRNLYMSGIVNVAFMYKLYWRWMINKPNWMKKEKITIEDVANELRIR